MEFLEEFMPGMGDVLAAQENSLMSVVATLTAQMQHLVATNERQAQRVAQLETTQLSLRLTVKEMQNTPAPEPQVVEVQLPLDPAVAEEMAEAVAALTAKMEQLQQEVKTQVTEQLQHALVILPTSTVVDDTPTRLLLEEKLLALERKVVAKIGELRSEATDSLDEKTKATEEALKLQLEQLDKRFDYLSRVKMEVKELTKRADRQEQNIEDVRAGIEMLGKSLGSEDVESESSDEGEEEGEEAPEEEEQPKEEAESEPTTRKSSIHFLPMLASNESLPTTNDINTLPEVQEAEDKAQQATVEVAPQSEVPSTKVEPKPQPITSDTTPEKPKIIAPKLAKQRRRGSSRRKINLPTPAQLLQMPEAPVPEAIVETQVEEHVPVVAPLETTELSPSQQSEGECTTETVVAEESPAVEPTPATPIESAVELVIPVSQPTEDLKAEENTEVPKQEEQEPPKDALPQEYRSRMVTQQKQLDDQLDLFRSSSSSTRRATTLTSVIRVRRTRRASNVRRDSENQSADPAPMPPRSAGSRAMSVPVQKPQNAAATPPQPNVAVPRTPLTKEEIRRLWMVLLSKLVRMQRLRQLNGLNAERALFRKQPPISMGSRVKRLEESTGQLGESLEFLQRHVQENSSAITALDENIVEILPVVDKVQKMERTQKTQARTIVDVEEKMQEIDVEIQRLRTSARRNSSVTSSITTAVTSAISAQLQDVSAKFTHHVTAYEATEKVVTQVSETEIPAIHEKIELSLYTLRQEAEQRANEATLGFQKMFDQLQTTQRNADGNLVLRMTESYNRIYQTLLGMSGAILQAAELSRVGPNKAARSPLNIGIELLQGVFTRFAANCKSLSSEEAASEIDFVVEMATEFQQQLEKLKGQAAIAKAGAHSLPADSVGNNDHQHSSFEDHLVFITTAKLKELGGVLITRNSHKDSNQTPELTFYLKDAVVQMRSILFLLLLHAETMNSQHQIQDIRSSQNLIQNKVIEQGFAIGQLESTAALVKLMNSRLDTFMEFSFAYAKEDDVKKSIQELVTANNDMHELVTSSLEANRTETLERDGLLGEEMNQLIARVSKKLDKDELLWTQEVLERQVQNVANSSLDEHDLIDIHRRLRRKVDKNQLKSMMDQRSKLGPSTGSMQSTNTQDEVPKSPLIGAKCISCQGELPPTKAMIKNVVHEEVQQEVAKVRAQKLPPSSASAFNTSNHRSLEAFKKELLLASLQQKNATK